MYFENYLSAIFILVPGVSATISPHGVILLDQRCHFDSISKLFYTSWDISYWTRYNADIINLRLLFIETACLILLTLYFLNLLLVQENIKLFALFGYLNSNRFCTLSQNHKSSCKIMSTPVLGQIVLLEQSYCHFFHHWECHTFTSRRGGTLLLILTD